MPAPEELGETPGSRPFSKPLWIGLVLAILGAASGFYATWSGSIPLGTNHASVSEAAPLSDHAKPVTLMPDVAFVPVAPVIVSVGQGAERSHLRFTAELEVKTSYKTEVEELMPRIVDVTNTYLRALKLADFEDGLALVRLRAQLLRRMQVVTGGGRINDLLVIEFVLN
ncbi:flagellar basal body-associated FliL family protein [Roseovarius sp.]|uniref:flagellar basal body-associated FliL family protein n=1 Tax=Roseovarius sp. TaxID=1486281 RepID=UPI003A98153A